MMSVWKATALGAIQGLTEFLPVSSSGHLVIFKHFLRQDTPGAVWEATLHLGTLAAVFIVFWPQIASIVKDTVAALKALAAKTPFADAKAQHPSAYLLLLIIAGTIPTGIIGLTFKDRFEAMFSKPALAAAMIMLTGVLLWLSRYSPQSGSSPTLADALTLGFIQGIAIIPGISRSGSTISCALILGVERKAAATFSFLLCIPAVFGACILELRHGADVATIGWASLAAGFLTSLVVGYFALRALVKVVQLGRFHYFSIYCWAFGSLSLLFLTVRK